MRPVCAVTAVPVVALVRANVVVPPTFATVSVVAVKVVIPDILILV
jgi:hypothetical protein